MTQTPYSLTGKQLVQVSHAKAKRKYRGRETGAETVEKKREWKKNRKKENEEVKKKNRQHLTGIFFFGRVRHTKTERHVFMVWHLSMFNFCVQSVFSVLLYVVVGVRSRAFHVTYIFSFYLDFKIQMRATFDGFVLAFTLILKLYDYN